MTTTTAPRPTAVSTKTKPSKKNYAGFNICTVEGTVYHLEEATNNGQEFVVVQVIQNLTTDDEGCVFQFCNSNGVLKLYRDGHLTVGRRVHLTGHIKQVTSVYTDQKSGDIVLRKRPLVKMDQAQLRLGSASSK